MFQPFLQHVPTFTKHSPQIPKEKRPFFSVARFVWRWCAEPSCFLAERLLSHCIHVFWRLNCLISGEKKSSSSKTSNLDIIWAILSHFGSICFERLIQIDPEKPPTAITFQHNLPERTVCRPLGCESHVENSPWASRNSREWRTSISTSDRVVSYTKPEGLLNVNLQVSQDCWMILHVNRHRLIRLYRRIGYSIRFGWAVVYSTANNHEQAAERTFLLWGPWAKSGPCDRHAKNVILTWPTAYVLFTPPMSNTRRVNGH